jgi:hypothetical protein
LSANDVESLLPQALSPRLKYSILRVLEHPTVCAQGPSQVFAGDPALYLWLLDHPVQAVGMWRRLGAKCLEIKELGKSRFGWSDGEGSELQWSTVVARAGFQVWYAEGKIRPAFMLPAVPLRALVVMRHNLDAGDASATVIRQQANLYLQTDSKTAAVIARLLGTSAPRIAEQCLYQLETFFSGLVWYLNCHPGQLAILMPNFTGSTPQTPFVDDRNFLLPQAPAK